ncbi:MBL fold metallo-hydrolase [Shouchella shacheensis]|uniref:MBL fold metallo-hydrolase n=1 Tax=Shouchella shacheensis TaxID=1649580 RepID=UPI00073FD488|nr:MBL fold metallo-hydrolase [Shouchella shacheensis]
MALQWINERAGYFSGAVTIGYIKGEDTGILIDAGLDKQIAKKVIRQLEAESLPLTHLLITHAHTDHFGGAPTIQQAHPEASVYAPAFEEAVLAYPLFEPLYLFQGNEPVKDLRSKFLLGPSVKVDRVIGEGAQKIGEIDVVIHALPGHSHNQVGLEVDGILYAADAYLGRRALEKHVIPFQIDAKQVYETLEQLLKLDIKGALPGHGDYEETFQETVQVNMKRQEALKVAVEKEVSGRDFISLSDLVARVLTFQGLKVEEPGRYALFRTAILSFVRWLEVEQTASLVVEDNVLGLKGGEIHSKNESNNNEATLA